MLEPGTRLGAYEILEPIGAGGLGEVYKAKDLKLERYVAIKTLREELASEPDRLQRFKREARSASALNHPNIITIYDIGHHEDIPYIAMEYVEGKSLDRFLTEGSPPFETALEIAIQIAEGLAKAHAAGITHRDLKPENVMVSTDGFAKIVDFGLAKLHPPNTGGDSVLATIERQHTTSPGIIMGTPAFMSPEQARGLPVDHRTDLWSLGVVLYQMTSGALPFRGESAVDLLYAVANKPPEPVTCYADAPENIQRILDRALQKEPGARYQRAGEILSDLKALRTSLLTPPEGLGDRHPGLGTRVRSSAPPLPVRLTSFVGRERYFSDIKALISKTRLLTLTGPGGTGKTSLGLQVAAGLVDDFPGGVYFVPLASIADPMLVASAIARNLGIERPGDTAIVESLKAYLESRRALLMLDNFEHVLAAAPLLSALLEGCPALRVLVTSRAGLHVGAEHEYPVPPLELPDLSNLPPAESLARYEAIDLFVQRAQAVNPRFALDEENAAAVAAICVHLDGLPLAVELAAARTKLLSPRAMLGRLERRLEFLTGGARDAPARHRTLRSAIGWSYDLLAKGEQKMLRSLSTFAGGCSFEAAESVCGAGLDAELDVLDGLATLVDGNLLRQEEQADGESRFFMLESIRAFASEKSTECGESEGACRAHRDFFLDLAEKAAPHLMGVGQAAWFVRLELEHDNLRAAIDGCLKDPGGSEAGLRLSVALVRFWLTRGYWEEGRKRLLKLSFAAEGSASPTLRAEALSAAATLTQNQGDYSTARSLVQKALALRKEIGDTKGVATSLHQLGWMDFRLGDFVSARSLSEESLALHNELGDERGSTASLNNLSILALYRGDYATARTLLQQVISRRREQGDTRGLALALCNLGSAIARQGEYERGVSTVEEAVGLFREIGEKQLYGYTLNVLADILHENGEDERAATLLENESLPLLRAIGSKPTIARGLRVLGDIVLARGDERRARSLLEESLRLRREAGDGWGIASTSSRLGRVARRQADYRVATAHFEESFRLAQKMEDTAITIDCLEGLAGVASDEEQFERATRLFGAAQALRQTIGAPRPPAYRAACESDSEKARRQMGEEAFEASWRDGLELPLESLLGHEQGI